MPSSYSERCSEHSRKKNWNWRFSLFILMAGMVVFMATGFFPRKNSARVSPYDLNLTVCQNKKFDTAWGLGWAEYRCHNPCPSQDGRDCAYDSSASDIKGRALKTLAFVTNGAAGEMRFNLPLDKGYTAALLMHQGAGGTVYLDIQKEVQEFRKLLETEGLLVISVRWYGRTVASLVQGWGARRYANEASTLAEKTKRPAAVMKWAHDQLIPSGVRFGTLGCSAGSLATFSPVYWHGLDPIVDYQMITGGPPIAYDPVALCTGRATEPPAGICSNDPITECLADSDCGAERLARCVSPSKELAGRFTLDYVHSRFRTCLNDQGSEVFRQSGYRFTAGDWQVDHSVDFIMDVNESGRGDDAAMGIIYQSGMIYRNLETSDPAGKKWLIHEGRHCGWSTDQEYLSDTIRPLILRGLKLSP